MSFLDKLKDFVSAKFNINIHHLINVNVHVTRNDSSRQIEYHEAGRTLTINVEKFTPAQLDEFRPLLRGAVDEDDKIILEKESEALLEDIASKESAGDTTALLHFFKDKIPKEDYSALRAALYVRKSFQEGSNSDVVHKLRNDIIRKYSRRGRNISNLCSSGYFEKMIKPIYEEMKRSPDFSQEEFLEYYNTIIEEEAFAVFVSGGMSTDEVRQEVENKIKRNLRYGISHVSIHGIGRNNVDTIKTVIYELKGRHPMMKVTISESDNIIAAKLRF